MTGQHQRLSRDTVFEVLSNSRRRFILATLRRRGSPISVSRLARLIGAHEDDVSPSEISASEEKRVYVSLYQSHIPKLEAAGFVEYDEEARSVMETPATAEIDRYLGPVPPAVHWPRLNGIVSLAAGTTFLASAADVGVLTALSPYTVGGAVVLVLLSVTVAQYADHRRRSSARPPELREH
ncbi:winged helix-turn-helix domain-containing protein [Halomicroarcula sp. F13]|uniref:Winged helix-turn-helix domain-containing protein n=1 Tax=Haloarcula rubra TaxID=2487747 RepID=A0AAW4PS01_9EURY|nr:winged helix-turn-helix domain-containing protein [Halomicroarcula rubra]MBX0323173.1 winged helix-turn-helix domain-containing protein [Halomicroarcula rubra]